MQTKKLVVVAGLMTGCSSAATQTTTPQRAESGPAKEPFPNVSRSPVAAGDAATDAPPLGERPAEEGKPYPANGRLPATTIRDVVRQHFGQFRICYEAGLARDPKLDMRVQVRFVIARDGSVTNVGDGGSDGDPKVTECVLRAFFDLKFPEPDGGIVRVTYPIRFSPG